MNIAVIAARGGSKRIPRKNVRLFAGRPVIAYPIEAAATSGVFERIIVSTDDHEIAEIGRAWGAEIPFMRPAALSDDHAGTVEVVAHATRWALDSGMHCDSVCCIYASAPLLQADDLKKGAEALSAGDWAYTFAATEFGSSIFRSFRLVANGGVEMLFPENYTARSQDLPRALHDAGQFYFGRVEAWLQHVPIFGERSRPIIIPNWRVQDIDTEEDWRRAELIWELLKQADAQG